MLQIIPLNGKAKIVRRTVFPKSGKMVETTRADSREGKLRSQLNISPEGHCHMRCASSTVCILLQHQLCIQRRMAAQFAVNVAV